MNPGVSNSLRSIVVLSVLLALGPLRAAQKAASPQQAPAAKPATQPISPRPAVGQENSAEEAAQQPNARQQVLEASREAAGKDEEAQFKHSPSVRFLAKLTGLNLETAYWVLVVLNFAILAGLLYFLMRKSVPAAFRARTESIRQGMEEGRRASEAAARKLADVEARLARLGEQIAALRSAGEAEIAKEEERIRADAQEERQRIIATAEQEIAAAASQARRDLKAFAADLAVGLAEKRMQLNPDTDRLLVRDFAGQLRRNGQ